MLVCLYQDGGVVSFIQEHESHLLQRRDSLLYLVSQLEKDLQVRTFRQTIVGLDPAVHVDVSASHGVLVDLFSPEGGHRLDHQQTLP